MIQPERRYPFFTTVEGIDFTGKTPITRWLKKDLQKVGFEVAITRDPPYRISPWDRFKKHFEKADSLSPIGEALLLLTARVDNYQKIILPQLQRGAVVVSDRFLDSWFAYQSVRLARHFGSDEIALNFLMQLNQTFVNHGLLAFPDMTLLIDNDPSVTMQRASEVKVLSKYEVIDTQTQVALKYQKLVRLFPERIVVIDARGKEVPEVYKDAKRIVLDALSGRQK